MEDNAQKNMPLSGPLIRAKVMRIYVHLADMGGAIMSDVGTSDPSPFQASREWFDLLKKCYGLCNVKLSGENAFLDYKVAKTFPAQPAHLLQEKWYLPEQLFNANKTACFGKRCQRKLLS